MDGRMTRLTTLRRQLLACCYRYAQATTPVQRYWRATEREQLVEAIRREKRVTT